MVRSKHRVGWTGVAFAGLSLSLLVLWGTGWVMYAWPIADLMDMTEMEAMLRRAPGVVHGVTTWGVCVLGGRGVWPHVQWMFHHRVDWHQWGWGLVNLTLLVVLAISGLLLLYGRADWHEALSPAHFWVGAFAPLPYILHGWKKLSRSR